MDKGSMDKLKPYPASMVKNAKGILNLLNIAVLSADLDFLNLSQYSYCVVTL